jgi:hypothetical protein
MIMPSFVGGPSCSTRDFVFAFWIMISMVAYFCHPHIFGQHNLSCQVNIAVSSNQKISREAKISYLIFSSHELKGQVSFSDRPLYVCPSIWRLSVGLLHFQLLLQNHWANFNQSWHKLSLVRGDSELYIWRTTHFPKGIIAKE